MSTETEADDGRVSYEYRGNVGQADLIETEADGGKDSFRDDELADLQIWRKDSDPK
jgi:hypothetical protein